MTPLEEPPDLSMECDLPLGRPGLVVRDELVLSGWAVSPAGISGIAVQIGDRVWNASYGLDTPSLRARLGDFPNVDRAGYHLVVDTSGWTPGSHYATVAAFDLEGGRAAIEGGVDVRPSRGSDTPGDAAPTTVALDEPPASDGVQEIHGPLRVSGWAQAGAGIEAVMVTIDGRVQHEALRPIARPDLLDSHGPEIAAGAGFALELHPSECPPGRHELTVVAIGRDGTTAGVGRELLCLDSLSTSSHVAPIAPAAPPSAATWEDRARLAEADAALSRAEARLALRGQEAALRALALRSEVLDRGAGPADEQPAAADADQERDPER